MIITTSPTIEGRTIKEYIGVVSAAQVLGMAGGNKAVQRSWQNGVEGATATLVEQAVALGANAVISASFQPFDANIYATGTAVRLA